MGSRGKIPGVGILNSLDQWRSGIGIGIGATGLSRVAVGRAHSSVPRVDRELSAACARWSPRRHEMTSPAAGFVFSRNAAQELARMKEHEIVCQPEAAKASRALREMYEDVGG